MGFFFYKVFTKKDILLSAICSTFTFFNGTREGRLFFKRFRILHTNCRMYNVKVKYKVCCTLLYITRICTWAFWSNVILHFARFFDIYKLFFTGRRITSFHLKLVFFVVYRLGLSQKQFLCTVVLSNTNTLDSETRGTVTNKKCIGFCHTLL